MTIWLYGLPSHRWDISSGYTTALHCWPATTNHLTCPCSPWSFPLCPDPTALARKLSEKEETDHLLLTKLLFKDFFRFCFLNYIASFLDIRWWITKWSCFSALVMYTIYHLTLGGLGMSLASTVCKVLAPSMWCISLILWVIAGTFKVNTCSYKLVQTCGDLSRIHFWTLWTIDILSGKHVLLLWNTALTIQVGIFGHIFIKITKDLWHIVHAGGNVLKFLHTCSAVVHAYKHTEISFTS